MNETITIDGNCEAATDAEFANKLNSGDKIEPGSTIYVRFASTSPQGQSSATVNQIADRPATPATKPEIAQSAKMVQVTNASDSQEYKFEKNVGEGRTATFGEWQSSPVFIDDDMQDGDTYTVATRVKATDSQFASEEIDSDSYTAQNTPENSVILDGGSKGEEWTDNPYEIPINLLTKGGETYMVEIDWGDMLFTYNFGTWDTDTLSYNDDQTTLHWGTSFDGINNKVNVINRSSAPINSTIAMTVDQDKQDELQDLGFHLTTDNENSNANNYPTAAQTLQSGSTGNSTTAYVNIQSDDAVPNDTIAEKYNDETLQGTEFGNITVTVQKETTNP